ncbi:efflux transporter outer membrane subunit [Ideonella azotifigens]|uniref:Efflux transporter outer membrane subunit n=2 Tax=Ideonella azotifigens TaxID=513160 RepID=A0ABN1KKA9_9BURK
MLALSMMGGCAQPPAVSPAVTEVPLPPAWQTVLDSPMAAQQQDWWRQFQDPVLVDWVNRALARNTDLATAVARLREARAQENLARAALSPTLDFSLPAQRARSVNAFGQGSTSSVVQPQFQAAYELDLFGRVDQQVRGAQASTLASEHALAAMRLSVAAATASGYLTLRTLDARLLILQDTLVSRAEALKLAQGRAQAGYTSDLELHQAEAEYQATAQSIPPVQTAIARQAHALSLLAGEPPGPAARGLALAALVAPPVPEGLPSELLRRRPDIAQAEATLAASDASLAVARAQFMPQFRLTGSAGRVWSNLLDAQVNIWSLGASVLAPIFEGGRLQAQAEAALARRDQAALAYQRSVLGALREVEDALVSLGQLADQRAHLEAQRRALAEALKHATNRYHAGYSPYLEQLDAQRSLLSTELSLAQTVGDQLTAAVALQQAMGGGWEGDARR